MKKCRLVKKFFLIAITLYFLTQFFSIAAGNARAASNELQEQMVVLTVGADESERNLTWYVETAVAGKVLYAVKDGEDFPAAYAEAAAQSTESKKQKACILTMQPLKICCRVKSMFIGL